MWSRTQGSGRSRRVGRKEFRHELRSAAPGLHNSPGREIELAWMSFRLVHEREWREDVGTSDVRADLESGI